MNGGMKAPVQDDPLQEFLSLTLPDVELAAATARSPVGRARMWEGLGNVMCRRGYWAVRELGEPAAAAWAGQLGVLRRRGG